MIEFSETPSDYGVITGVLIHDDTMSENEFRYLCTVGNEELFLWCLDQNGQCHLCSKPNLVNIGQKPYWKTAAALFQLSIAYAYRFEAISVPISFDYMWISSFDPQKKVTKKQIQQALAPEMSIQFHSGLSITIEFFLKLVKLAELLDKSDKLYTALSTLYSSFEQHYCCLHCELELSNIYHEHKANELPIWQQVAEIPKLELAVIQACRAAEAILGEPPKREDSGKILKFVNKWSDTIGWDPKESFEKAGKTYLDFYYELFFSLRNPSAHSRGNVHYDLERTRTATAQCFAYLIVEGYLKRLEEIS